MKNNKRLIKLSVAVIVVLLLVLVVLLNAVGKKAPQNKQEQSTAEQSSSEDQSQSQSETKAENNEMESVSENESLVDGTISQTNEAGETLKQEFQTQAEKEEPLKVNLFERKEVVDKSYDRELEQACLNDINAQRASANLGALAWDEDLYAWVKIRGPEIAETFSHKRPDGTDAYSVIPDGEYSFVGESIGTGLNMFSTSQEVVAAWMGNEDDKANILDEDYDRAAVVCYIEKDVEGNMCYYWVAVFRKK